MIEFVSTFPVLLNYQCFRLNGLTPLIVTILRGTIDQVYQLLSVGANVHLSSWNGMTPIEWAIHARRDQIFHLLMVHLAAVNESFDLNLKQYYVEKFLTVTLNNVDLETKIHQPATNANICKIQHTSKVYQVDYSIILR